MADDVDRKLERFTFLLKESVHPSLPHGFSAIEDSNSFMVKSSLRFFESNLKYYADNSFEFQRLVAHLPTAQLRRRFLRAVQRKYEIDVSQLLQSNRDAFQTKLKDMHQRLFASSNTWASTSATTSADAIKIGVVFRYLLETYPHSAAINGDALGKLLLHLNSQETQILEGLMTAFADARWLPIPKQLQLRRKGGMPLYQR
eukprot:TRINITY_DN9429_c0_g1_i1.p1 TRINITY_DN9429_c0_g1~~TRINITY_DN9429_c0_g1_i1.p1  ORF type:complete len:201 (+),score=36.92 TRINITY_DN9429_c0_g1_i1:80-682(+)